jgi:hypothetical protein
MQLKLTAVPILALLLGASCLVPTRASAIPTGSLSPELGQDHDRDRGDWDGPPREFNDIQRRGFHDGIEGARKDLGNHRRPDVNNRDEYRHPDVPREVRRAYRDAFRRGYQQAIAHLMEDHDRH